MNNVLNSHVVLLHLCTTNHFIKKKNDTIHILNMHIEDAVHDVKQYLQYIDH